MAKHYTFSIISHIYITRPGQDCSIAIVLPNAHMDESTATEVIRNKTDDSSPFSTSFMFCELIDLEAEESDYLIYLARAFQDEAELFLHRIVGFGRSASLKAKFEEILKGLSQKKTNVEDQRTVVCDILGKVPTLYVGGLLRGLMVASKCYCVHIMAVVLLLLSLL